MAMLPVGGTLFADGGGAGGAVSSSHALQNTPGGVHSPSHGKNSVQQNLVSPHSGMRSTISGGEPLSRSMQHYGKGHSFTSPLKQIRGATGQMRRIRGGLGPGKTGQPGSASDYSMTTGDTE